MLVKIAVRFSFQLVGYFGLAYLLHFTKSFTVCCCNDSGPKIDVSDGADGTGNPHTLSFSHSLQTKDKVLW